MFVEFFYDLRKAGMPISSTAFLRLQKVLYMGLVRSLDDFYVMARTLMVIANLGVAIIVTVAACREALGADMTMMVHVAYAWRDASRLPPRSLNPPPPLRPGPPPERGS